MPLLKTIIENHDENHLYGIVLHIGGGKGGGGGLGG